MLPKCIFMDKPKECSVCLESRMLHCILNKKHLKLTEEGKALIIKLVTDEASNPERYKTKAGEEQRPK